MGQSNAILDKIKRNLDILGISASRGAASVVADGMTISYVDAEIQNPMGGVDGSASPFLGINKANPGKLKLKGDAGENTIAAIFTSALRLKVLAVLGNFANDKIIEAGDTTAELAVLEGHPDLKNLGQ